MNMGKFEKWKYDQHWDELYDPANGDNGMNMCIHPDQNEWSDEYPTEPGTYWFYGWSHKTLYNHVAELHIVNVKFIGNSKTRVFITDGGFLTSNEGAHGKWRKAVLPELPELERPE